MCEEGECSLLGSESCSLSHSFNPAGTRARLQCWHVQRVRTADGAMLCSSRIFSPGSRRWEPDPRTAGPALWEVGQQQAGPG